MIRAPFISFTLILAITACKGRDPVDDKATNALGPPIASAAASRAAGEQHVSTAPTDAAPATTARIPPALQGRWGLTPSDCTSALGDAKGLLVIDANELRFYESRAVPLTNIDADSDSISGTFAFTGEGQSWSKYETLKIDKSHLTRTESKPTVSFSYAKCS